MCSTPLIEGVLRSSSPIPGGEQMGWDTGYNATGRPDRVQQVEVPGVNGRVLRIARDLAPGLNQVANCR